MSSLTDLMDELGENDKKKRSNVTENGLLFNSILRRNLKVDDDGKQNNFTTLHPEVEEGLPIYRDDTKKLIMDGNCFNVKNNDGIKVLDRIPSNIIEEILDECIGEHKGSLNDRKNENYELKMDLHIFSHKNNEANFIRALQYSQFHKHLLSHPVVATFLHIKWQKLKYIWYINLALNFLTNFLVLLHIGVAYGNINTNLLFLKIIITTMVSVQFVREYVQLINFKLYYFKDINNYVEVTILVMTMFMLFDKDINQQSIAAWLIVFIAVQLLLFIEKLHLLQISIYISMFRRITYNFVKLTSLLFCLIIAFGVSFYLLIHLTPNDGAKDKIIEQSKTHHGRQTIFDIKEGLKKNDTRFERSLIFAILKTAIMSTGEFDYSSLDFQHYPAASLLFALFVFSIFLVAMNLLNGIAISDIRAIQNDAIKYQIQDQVECMFNFEISKSIYSKIFGTKYMTRGHIFENCFYSKVISSYPNRNFPMCSVICDGHNDYWYTNKFYSNFMKLISYISCNKCGCVENLCQYCKNMNTVKDHTCEYSHHYMIPPKYVFLAKKIKEQYEVDEQRNKTEARLNMIEKCILEQKTTTNNLIPNQVQTLKEIYNNCIEQKFTFEEFVNAIGNKFKEI